MKTTLKKYFGYDSFRPLQESIIENVMGNGDTFVLMPTGGGKSLCYQMPALMLPGLTLVISPLIALMKDQVDALKENGVEAEFINSTQSQMEIDRVIERAARNEIKLIYVAPERFAVPSFQEFLKNQNISLIAIDEAHCISEWGHDFRPEYRNLRQLKKLFPQIPLIALTATATPKVKDDIIGNLGIGKAKVFISSFDRKNLQIEIFNKKDAFHKLVGILQDYKNDSAIIYCHSRSETEEIAANLRLNGFNAGAYHAGLEASKRRSTQELFIKDKVNIIVATVAFGMGIDKPDVRLVVHYTFPKTLESYYQEIGRAGRDGLPSRCIMFYTYADLKRHEFFINRIEDPNLANVANEKLAHVLDFCELRTCRKKYLLKYFSEEMEGDNCQACDICLSDREKFDATVIAQKILSAVLRTGSRFGKNYIIEVLKGKNTQKVKINKHDALSVYGLAKDIPEEELSDIIKQLVAHDYLQKTEDQYPVLHLTQKGVKFLNDKETLMLEKPLIEISAKTSKSKETLDYNKDLFQLLRSVRKDLADERHVAPFMVFGDRSLMEMAYYLPMDKNSFGKITGVGKRKLEELGDIFISAIKDFAEENDLSPQEFPVKALKRGSIDSVDIKIEKPKFHQKTKELLIKKIPIDRIAKNQNLAESTIVNHIEKLIDAGERLDLDYLRLPKDRYEAMADGFREVGDERLKPVFEYFNGKYSYDELRLARVLMRAEQI